MVLRQLDMQTIQIRISERDLQRYGLQGEAIKFTDLVEKISLEYARQSLLECHVLAEQAGLSTLTLEEINAEIKAVRDAESHS